MIMLSLHLVAAGAEAAAAAADNLSSFVNTGQSSGQVTKFPMSCRQTDDDDSPAQRRRYQCTAPPLFALGSVCLASGDLRGNQSVACAD